ncbi:14067_t:CDS:2 [Racocetra persica]|uniref:14067_t:CDS:1 n=1 Tax=Racocetra persica TaxID=160502 RepID=A0ACA9KHM2_9GLOM|nr:14067_t:CDS:2 [Racocetra persica]
MVYSSKGKLVKALLDKAKNLVRKSYSENWNKRLDKAWKTYLEYCGVTGQRAILSSKDFLLSCLIWLDLTDAVLVCSNILAAVSREHLERSLPDPSKLYNVRRLTDISDSSVTIVVIVAHGLKYSSVTIVVSCGAWTVVAAL